MRKIRGFTLAEVLITLTVIGIVAAISLPALMQNVNERTWNTKRKALLSRMSAAISQIDDIGNYGKYETDDEGNVTDTMAESFVVDGLSKVYKIKNVCDANNMDKCGMPATFNSLVGSSKTLPKNTYAGNVTLDIKPSAVAIETVNGEKLAVYYNPGCRVALPSETTRNLKNMLCVNFIYDLNGLDEPNEIGKDMGVMSVMYGTEQEPEVVAPNPYAKRPANAPFYSETNNAASACKALRKDLTLPSVNELASMIVNTSFITEDWSSDWEPYISGTVRTPGNNGSIWGARWRDNLVLSLSKTYVGKVICVKE